jgi:capsular exopolysaccharide synthesis family protein
MSQIPSTPATGASAAVIGAMTARNQSLLWFYLGILRRRIWIILPILVIVTTLGVIQTFRTPYIFMATSKVLVERQGSPLVSLDRSNQDGGQAGPNTEFYQTQVQLVRSRSVLDLAMQDPPLKDLVAIAMRAGERSGGPKWFSEVIRTVLATLGIPRTVAMEPWEALSKCVVSSHVADTHFVLVQAMGRDAHAAAVIANSVAGAFEQYHRQQAATTLSEAFVALKAEKEKQERNLLEAERALQEFREKAESLTVPTSKEDQPAVERLSKLNSQLTEVQLRRIELTSQLGVMHHAASSNDTTTAASDEALFALPVIKSDTTLVDNRKMLADAEKDLAVLSDTYGKEHPLFTAGEAKVKLLREQFMRALTEVIRAHENKLKMLQGEEKELERQYEEQKRTAVQLAKENFTYTRLDGAVTRHRQLFEALVNRMREVDMSSGLIRTSVQIVERASPPKTAVNASRLRGMLISLLVGTFLGVGIAFLVENLDDTIKTPEDLTERLPVPLLGFVPVMGKEEAPQEEQRPDLEKIAVALPEKARDEDEARYFARGTAVLSQPASSVAEAFRSIRTSLFYSTPAHKMRIVAITSCRPQEGKTTTITNLAISVSQTGKKVLLVDGDLHRPTTHRVLGIRSDMGLTDVLVGESTWQDALQSVVLQDGRPLEHLRLLPAGRTSPNPAELVGSQRMRDLLEEWRQAFDWVFLDTPPVLFVSDASILGALADGVILLVRAGSSTQALVSRAREQLESVNARVVGSVLNGMIVSKVGRYYSYYQYHGYSRYAKDYHRTYYSDDTRSDEKFDPAAKA